MDIHESNRDDLDEEDKLWHTSLPVRWKDLSVEGIGTGEELSSNLAVSLGLGLVEKATDLVDRLVNSSCKIPNKLLLHNSNGVVQRVSRSQSIVVLQQHS